MLVAIPVLRALAPAVALGLERLGHEPRPEVDGHHVVFWLDVSSRQPAIDAADQCGDLIELIAREVNLPLIRHARAQGNPLPRLSDGAVWFAPEPWDGEFEEFAPLDVCLRRGRCDCDDAVAWRLADLWDHGELGATSAGYCRFLNGERYFHGQIRRESGLIEDPSRNLGM